MTQTTRQQTSANTPRRFRVRWALAGGHVHCRLFVQMTPNSHAAKLGDFTMDLRDWEAFQAQTQDRFELLPEDPTMAEFHAQRDAAPTEVRDTADLDEVCWL